jgi:threonine dehydrogenase-like Zn-dependent dehydrogenase
MQATVFHAAQDVRVEGVQQPQALQVHEVLLCPRCGSCGTGRHEYLAGPDRDPGGATSADRCQGKVPGFAAGSRVDRVDASNTVAVPGAGPIGQMCAMAAVSSDAWVILIEPQDTRRAWDAPDPASSDFTACNVKVPIESAS